MRERAEVEAPRAAGEEPASKGSGVDDGRRYPPTERSLDHTVEERDVETGVVSDEDGLSREGEKAADGRLDAGGAAKHVVADPGERRGRGRERPAGVDEGLERPGRLERAQADGADLADASARRRETGRLEVDDDERRRLEGNVECEARRERNARAAPGKASVRLHDLAEQRSREPDGRACEREKSLRRLVRGDGPTVLLDELDEPVGGVQPKLHGEEDSERMFGLPPSGGGARDGALREDERLLPGRASREERS